LGQLACRTISTLLVWAAIATLPALASTDDPYYNWLLTRVDGRTGLGESYDGDPQLKNVAFAYDQALLVMAFTQGRDYERARKILHFFDSRAVKKYGFYLNAYDTSSGSPWQYEMHSGPNLWLGIAALTYAKKTGDDTFIPFAAAIGDRMIELQDEDPERGLRGGPEEKWYSSEHNIDAYVFFAMLHQATGETRFASAGRAALDWLSVRAFEPGAGRIRRGKNDDLIATDVYTWAISGIGPVTLAGFGLDASRLMSVIETQCRALVEIKRPGAEVETIRGFDFTNGERLSRREVISTEWTAQAVIAYRILARREDAIGNGQKSAAMLQKADLYLGQLEAMSIRYSDGTSGLPYASHPGADTGHGWKTPQGDSTGSIAGTAYYWFARQDYNPLGAVSS